MTFLDVWIGYTIFGVSLFSAAFIWAVRTRQFSNLEHGRHIALRSPEDPAKQPERKASLVDKYTWLTLAALTLAVIMCVLWLGYRHR